MKETKLSGKNKKGMSEVGRKMDEHSIISFRLLMSYLIIMVAPAIAIVVVYFAARDAMLDVQKEKAYRQLSEAVLTYDQQMDEVRNVGVYVAQQRELIQLRKEQIPRDKAEQFYQMFLMANSYPNYSLINQAVGTVYILVMDMEYIVELPHVIPVTDLGIKTLESLQNKSYEELTELFYAQSNYGGVLNISYGEDNWAQTDIAYVSTVASYLEETPDCAVAITFDEDRLRDLMKQSLFDEEGLTFLVNEKGEIIRSLGLENYGLSMGKNGTLLEEYVREMGLEKDMIRYSMGSRFTGWSFVSFTSKASLLRGIGSVRNVIILLCVVSIGIGMMICFLYWHQRKRMVKRYMSIRREHLDEKGKGFWNSFDGFLDKVENLQTTVSWQQVIVRKEILRKLLYGGYESQEELRSELGPNDNEIYSGEHYFVVVLEYEDPMKDNLYGSTKEFQTAVEEYFARNLPWVHWIYGISPLSYGLIIACDGEVSREKMKAEFEKLNYHFYKNKPLDVFSGISRASKDILHVSGAFEEAVSICEYARLFGIRVPLLKEDLPKHRENFVFTIEMEMYLEHVIKNGSEEELEKQLQEIKESSLNCFHEFPMTRHVMEILRCTVNRSLEQTRRDKEAEDILEMAKKAQRPQEMFEVIRRANGYYQNQRADIEKQESLVLKKKVSALMEERYSQEDFNLAMAAREMEIGEQRLYREIKDAFGISFSELLEQTRIRNACGFLKERMAVKAVAVQTGYASDYSFRRAFKRVTGMSPSEYQKIQK